MSNDLHRALHDTTEQLTLDRPVADIVARGDRLRRGRRRLALGGAAAVMLGAGAVSVVSPQGSSPLVPSASAAWGPQAVNLTPAQLEEVGRACRESFFDPLVAKQEGMGDDYGWKLPAGVEPVAADQRDGLAIAFYRHGGMEGSCTVELKKGGTVSASWDETEPLAPGQHLAFHGLVYGHETEDGPIDGAAGQYLVSPEVDRVEVSVGGTTVDAAVHGGAAFFWLPGGSSQAELGGATVAAYGADGAELVSGGLTNHPPVPADGGASQNDDVDQ